MTFQAGWLSAASIIPSDPAAGLEIILSHAEGDNIFPSGLLKDELLDPTNFTESFLDPSVSTNEFIIRRFCSTYPIENWALDIVNRTFLLASFSRRHQLPDLEELATVLVLVKDLRLKLPDDIWRDICPHIIWYEIDEWRCVILDNNWNPSFGDLSSFERAMTVIFIDAIQSHGSYFQALNDIHDFYVEPHLSCPGALDILQLGNRGAQTLVNGGPEFNGVDCTCGGCLRYHGALLQSSRFRASYYAVFKICQTKHCNALEIAWEDSMSRAEAWLAEAVSFRTESFEDPFPVSPNVTRLGPTIFEIANACQIKTGHDITDPQDLGPVDPSFLDTSTSKLLKFAAMLRLECIRPKKPPKFMSDSVPSTSYVEGVGYLLYLEFQSPVTTGLFPKFLVTGNCDRLPNSKFAVTGNCNCSCGPATSHQMTSHDQLPAQYIEYFNH